MAVHAAELRAESGSAASAAAAAAGGRQAGRQAGSYLRVLASAQNSPEGPACCILRDLAGIVRRACGSPAATAAEVLCREPHRTAASSGGGGSSSRLPQRRAPHQALLSVTALGFLMG